MRFNRSGRRPDLDLDLDQTHQTQPFLSVLSFPLLRNYFSTQTIHRDFLKASVADLKKQNPGFLLMVREGEGIPAAAHARYDGGKELAEKLDGLDAAGVEGALAKLVEKGAKLPRTAESAGDLPGVAK